jgi:hypothetical protein
MAAGGRGALKAHRFITTEHFVMHTAKGTRQRAGKARPPLLPSPRHSGE